MRKRQEIHVVDRRTKGSWVNAINPSPSSTVSSPDTNVSNFPGTGDPTHPCTSDIPTHRDPCGEDGTDLGFGWVPPNKSAPWVFFPSENTPISGSGLDQRYWTVDILLDDFPFIDYINGDPLTLFGISHATIHRPLSEYVAHPYQDHPFAPIVLQYTGAAFQSTSVGLHGLSTYLAQNMPYETVTKFQFFKINDGNRMNNVVSGGGVIFGYNDILNMTTFNSQGSSNMNSHTVSIETKPYQGPGFPSYDYISINGTNLAASPNFVYIQELEGCGGLPMQETASYYLRVRIDTGGMQAKLWLTTEPEPAPWSISGTTIASYDYSLFKPGFNVNFFQGVRDCDNPVVGSPCLDFDDQSLGMTFSSLIVNPSSPGVIGDDCDIAVPDGSGYYFDTLIPRSGYWIPASANVSYYKQVYFDGLPVFEGENYWLDGVKVHPQDPSIFDTTTATAEVVIN